MTSDRQQPGRRYSPLNECPSCGQDFASLAAFDEHILSAPSNAVFACLQVAELLQAGWTQNERARWTSPKLAAKADGLRQHFDASASLNGTRRRPARSKEGSDSREPIGERLRAESRLG